MSLDIEHRPTFEDHHVQALVVEALRRDLAGNPWYERLTAIQQSALTAAVVVSLAEILPGFTVYAKAVALERAIREITQSRGYPQPIGSHVEGELTELVIRLEDERDRLTEPNSR